MSKLIKPSEIFTILSLGSIWLNLEYISGINVTVPNVVSIALSLSFLVYFFKSAMSFGIEKH